MATATTKAKKKFDSPITLFCSIDVEQHEALRVLAFKEKRSVADIVREAIDQRIQRSVANPSPDRESVPPPA